MTNIKPQKKKTDILFSKWIRRGGKCEHCGRTTMRLECAHINSRRFLVTRYEPINAVCLCSACHRWGHDRPPLFTEWLKEYLGEAIYDELKLTANTKVVKLDYKQIQHDIKTLEGKYKE
jgi:hypothetical protein